jgi:hypothetical protein
MGRSLVVTAVTLALSAPAVAADDPGVEIHAFVSQGVVKSTGNNFLVTSKRGSFALTEVGINFTRALTENLRAGVQLFGGGFVGTGQYNAKADWFYLDYRFRDWLGFRAGRVKLPVGLYNEISDIDAARVPILLPQSTYPAANRNYLLAQTGVEVYGYLRLGPRAGALEYRLYGGTIIIDAISAVGTYATIQTPYVAGGRLMWEGPIEGLRLGGSLQALRLDLAGTVPTGPFSFRTDAVLAVGSLEYTRADLLLAAEYSRWRAQTVNSTNPMVAPIGTTVSERYYALGAYRLRGWLQLGAYYSGLYPNVDQRSGRESMQHDVAGTLRFDINPHWLVKLEGHFIHGTASLSRALNDNRALNTLTSDWAVFLAKTTAYF